MDITWYFCRLNANAMYEEQYHHNSSSSILEASNGFFSHNLMVKPDIFLLNRQGRGNTTRAGVTWKHREAGPGQDRRRPD